MNKIIISISGLGYVGLPVAVAFSKNNYKIQSKIFENCEHRIPTEGSSLGLEFLKKNLYK